MSETPPSFPLPGITSWTDLLRPAGWTFGIQVLGAGLGYGVHVLIGRWLGADIYGMYLLAMGWAVLLSRFEGLGLPTAVLRLVPEYDTKKKYGLLRGLLRSSRGMVIGTGLLVSLIATLAFHVLPLFPDAQMPAVLAGVWLAPLLALVGLETEFLRAHGRVVWAYAPPRLMRPLLLMAGIGVVAFGPLPGSTPLVLGLVGGLLILVFLVQYTGTGRVFPSPTYSASPQYDLRAWVQLAGPLFLMKGFRIIIAKTDLLVIGALLPAEQVGLYGAALRTAQVITFVGMALDSIASSAVTRLHTKGELDELQRFAGRIAQFYFWPTFLLAMGIAGTAPFILGLFGPSFVASQPALLVLMGGLLVNASTGCQNYLLTLTGHHRVCTWIYGCAMVLNLVLNVAGITAFGTMGAALATAGTMLFWNGCMYLLVVQRLGIDPTIFAFFRSSRPA